MEQFIPASNRTPREGDIVLYDDHNPMWRVLYKMVGSGMPDHSGIAVSLPDGQPALLESAPDDGKLVGPYVALLTPVPRLNQFHGCFANSMYPLDLFQDTDYDLSATWDKPVRWSPAPLQMAPVCVR